MIGKRILKALLSGSAALMTVLLILPQAAHNQVVLSKHDPALKILSYSVTPATLQKNRINFVTLTFRLKKDGRKLQGGEAALNYQHSKGSATAFFFDLEDKAYKKNKGRYSISFGLLPGSWKSLKIRSLRITDARDRCNTNPTTIRLTRSKKVHGERQGSKAGQYAYDFSLIDYKGKKITLSDYLGKVVLIDFSSMWCGPCQTEAAQLQNLYETYKNEGLVVLSVLTHAYEIRTPSDKELKKWARKYKITFPLMADPIEGVYNPYVAGDRLVPYNFIIGKKGKLRWRKAGYLPSTHTEIENKIVELLNEQ